MTSLIAAMRDAVLFLVHQPEIAACAHVIVTPEGGVSLQLVADLDTDEETRVGFVYGLAGAYSGDLRVTSDRHLVVDLRWRERDFRVWTPTVAPVLVTP